MSARGKQVAKVTALITGGAVIGAGLGLLFAPKSGAHTRRDLRRYAKKAQVQALRVGRSVQAGVKDAMNVHHNGSESEEQLLLSTAMN